MPLKTPAVTVIQHNLGRGGAGRKGGVGKGGGTAQSGVLCSVGDDVHQECFSKDHKGISVCLVEQLLEMLVTAQLGMLMRT